MNRGRAEITDAIIRISLAQGQATNALGQAASAGEYSLAQGRAASASKRQAHEEVQEQAANAAGQAARAGEYSSAQEAAGSHSTDSSIGPDSSILLCPQGVPAWLWRSLRREEVQVLESKKAWIPLLPQQRLDQRESFSGDEWFGPQD